MSDIRLLGPYCLVLPLYEAKKVFGLWLPDAYSDSISRIGCILRVGKACSFQQGDVVLYRPYQGRRLILDNQELFVYADWDIIAKVNIDPPHILPRADNVVVAPEWEVGGINRHNGLYTVDKMDYTPPQKFGQVIDTGTGASHLLGHRVVLPPEGGFEIGFIDRVLYILPASELLAICN